MVVLTSSPCVLIELRRRRKKAAPEADLAVPLSAVINPTEHF